jgi:hypothetical protein
VIIIEAVFRVFSGFVVLTVSLSGTAAVQFAAYSTGVCLPSAR